MRIGAPLATVNRHGKAVVRVVEVNHLEGDSGREGDRGARRPATMIRAVNRTTHRTPRSNTAVP
jgi:hypothetical protein